MEFFCGSDIHVAKQVHARLKVCLLHVGTPDLKSEYCCDRRENYDRSLSHVGRFMYEGGILPVSVTLVHKSCFEDRDVLFCVFQRQDKTHTKNVGIR